MRLSFVGSSKCYTFVNFVTLIFYQYIYRMSTDSRRFHYINLDIVFFKIQSDYSHLDIC